MTSASTEQNGGDALKYLPSTSFSNKIDHLVLKTGKTLSWLWAFVIAVIMITILVRYGAAKLDIKTDSYLLTRLLSSVFWEELTWYLYGYAWLFGMSYALVFDDHVRVDLLHEKLNKQKQIWIEIIGALFFLLPTLFIIMFHGLDFAISSFNDSEGSSQVGLDFMWIIKFAIPISMLFIVLAGVSRLSKCFEWIRRKTGKKIPLSIAIVLVLSMLYYASFLYFMYEWSAEDSPEPMTIFRIFGLSGTGE